MINTPNGVKSPEEALNLFIEAKMNKGSLLGILTQLQGVAPIQARLASEHAIKFPANYNDKIVRKATEFTTGRSIGAKGITNVEDTLALLEKFGPRATVEITFRKDATKNLPLVARLHPKMIKFDYDHDVQNLISCVYVSSAWQFISRDYTVMITASPDELRTVAEALAATVEKIELKHNLIDRSVDATGGLSVSLGGTLRWIVRRGLVQEYLLWSAAVMSALTLLTLPAQRYGLGASVGLGLLAILTLLLVRRPR